MEVKPWNPVQRGRSIRPGPKFVPTGGSVIRPGAPFLLTMKQALSLGFGAALLAASLYGLGESLFLAEEIPVGVLSAACFYGAVAIYWLWADLSGGYSETPAEKRISGKVRRLGIKTHGAKLTTKRKHLTAGRSFR